MSTEVFGRADFSRIRYGQVWEDADVLLGALAIQENDHCLSIASAGDNSLSLLTQKPARVVALDLNPAQLACLDLRVAAYRTLRHNELLQLIGSRPCTDRHALYLRCRSQLRSENRRFWDSQRREIEQGIGGAGKFEHYFALFRDRVLPWVHGKKHIRCLLAGGDHRQRLDFYNSVWNNRRWRWMFRLFFSRFVMGRFGRDPAFFRYVENNVAEEILRHTRYALTELNPADNPYLHWILTGTHPSALPHALRAENFDSIREYLHRLQWHALSVEDYIRQNPGVQFQRLNLSDIFEYMSPENHAQLLATILTACTSKARLVYWNMMVLRSRPESLADSLIPLTELAQNLYRRDKAFFYRALVVEEVR